MQLRDDSELTPTFHLPPGAYSYQLLILPNVSMKLSESLEDSVIKTEYCEVNYPLKYHECDVHAIFLVWSK